MTGKELTRWMDDNQISVTYLSKLIKTPIRTIYHWKKGERRVPGLFEAWLQLWSLKK